MRRLAELCKGNDMKALVSLGYFAEPAAARSVERYPEGHRPVLAVARVAAGHALRWLSLWRQRMRSRCRQRDLNDHILKDIGVSRIQIEFMDLGLDVVRTRDRNADH